MTSLGTVEILKAELYALCNLDHGTATCMVAGLTPPRPIKGSNLVLAHIMPLKTKRNIRELVSFQPDDIDSIRNCLLLSSSIEKAFDEQDISFVPPDNPFQADRFKMKIWNDAIRQKPVFPGAVDLTGTYDNRPLNLVLKILSGVKFVTNSSELYPIKLTWHFVSGFKSTALWSCPWTMTFPCTV